jgi:hypothetical protein
MYLLAAKSVMVIGSPAIFHNIPRTGFTATLKAPSI